MIHEALLYLWNCSGSFFNSNEKEEWLNLIELKDFLHPGERKLLQRILNIAADNHEIQEFIRTQNARNTSNNDFQIVKEVFQGNDLNSPNRADKSSLSLSSQDENVFLTLREEQQELGEGLYLKVFCNGMDAVLEDYRNDIIDLENTILNDPQLPLTFVVSRVEKYVTLFDALKSMIRVVKTENVHGCLLMGRLHKYYNCGVKIVADAATRIICSVNTVFYRHLCNWIIFGNLVDMYQEFFICDAKCSDEDFLWSRVPNERKNDLVSFNESLRGSRVRQPSKIRKFFIKENMVPSNITMELAQTILFMGRMVWIMRNDPTKTTDDKYELKQRDIWNGKEIYYFQKLQEMENHPFNLASFEKAIEDCRLCLTKYLWTVMVEEADLFDHLQLIRDYFALGRGELFQQFIISTEEHLKDVPNRYLILKLNTIFHETAKKIYSDSDKSYQRFEILFPKDAEESKEYTWPQIEMNFEIKWPLHIIFHPGAMTLYNKMFGFLLRVKKSEIDLQRLWLIHLDGKKQIHHGVWALRNTLMFLVNNLQYYLQVVVIEAQFAVLKKSVENAKNVEDIIKLHAEFLGNMISRTFLMSMNDKSHEDQKNSLYKLPCLNYTALNPVHKTLLHFLQLCDNFCTEASCWSHELNDLEQLELFKMQQKCDMLIDHLLGMLYSLREHTSGNHLSQLLHQLDFNRWFSKNKPDFNLSVI